MNDAAGYSPSRKATLMLGRTRYRPIDGTRGWVDSRASWSKPVASWTMNTEPYFMSGTLYFGCGSAVEEAPLWRLMLQRRTTRIVYWPLALPPAMAASADQWLRSHLNTLGVNCQLDTWSDLDKHQPSELNRHDVDLLFVGGGNTFRLLDAVRGHRFLEPVRDFWRDGGDYSRRR